MTKCIFLTSSAGGDYFALGRAKDAGLIEYSTGLVVSTDPDSKCYQDATSKGYPVKYIPVNQVQRQELNDEIGDLLSNIDFDLCFLTGYKCLLPSDITGKYKNKIINSHHSILPANPGLFKKEHLVQSDNKLLGASVHFVDAGVDTGEIICQAAFPNYGMNSFNKILRLYRQLQDVLIVNAFMLLNSHHFKNVQVTAENIIFWPAPEKSALNLFF